MITTAEHVTGVILVRVVSEFAYDLIARVVQRSCALLIDSRNTTISGGCYSGATKLGYKTMRRFFGGLGCISRAWFFGRFAPRDARCGGAIRVGDGARRNRTGEARGPDDATSENAVAW